MGNPKLSAHKKRKKRGRPQNPTLAAADDSSEDGVLRHRQKKLRHVLLSPISAPPPSDSHKLKLNSVDNGVKDLVSKVMDATSQEPSDCDPTTPLPDKKLLVIILDKLQKKDTYGVYSEPVDPDELPDYHDIIEHPMDFGTIRKKLADGVYTNLEQFENDVFLICSNAMHYNAPETIYYRQAQRIQELAQKKIEKLRQQSDENELEPRHARRGRPPIKNTVRKASGHPSECVGSDFPTDAAVAHAGENAQGSSLSYDLLRQQMNKSVLSEEPRKLCVLPKVEVQVLNPESKPDRNEDYSGSGTKGLLFPRNGKKFSTVDESRRSTHTQPQSCSSNYSSVLSALGAESRQLQPVGLHLEHTYARSLARFASNLGPVGWEVASKLIEQVLPPGMKFGRGWVDNDKRPKHSEPYLFRTSSHSSRHETAQSPLSESVGQPSNNLVEEDARVSTFLTQQPASSTVLVRSEDSVNESSIIYNDGFKKENCICENSIWPNSPSQIDQNPTTFTTLNGLNSQMGLNQLSQNEETLLKNFNKEATMMTHSRALDMITRKNSLVSKKPLGHMNINGVNSVPGSRALSNPCLNSESKQLGLSPNPKTGSAPPDLNVRFHSPGSPASSMVVDSPRQYLALQQ